MISSLRAAPLLAFGFLVASLAPLPCSAADDDRIASLVEQFDRWEAGSWPGFVATSLTSGEKVRDLYILDDAIAAYADLFEATGEERYLDRALTLLRNAMSTHPWTRPNGSRWWHEDMKATLSAGRVCRLARAAGRDVDDVVAFLDRDILGYHLLERPKGDHARGIDWALAVHLDEPPTATSGFWSGFQTLAARIAWDLHQLGVERWSDLAERLPRAFAARVEIAEDGSALWDVGRMLHSESQARTPDTGHYNRTVRWLVEVQRDGGVDRELLEALATTFRKRIYRPRDGQPYLANYIDGRDLPYGESPPGSGQLYDGWLFLGAIDPSVQRAGEDVLAMVEAGQARTPTYFIHARPTSRLALVAGVALNERRRAELDSAPQ